MALDGLGLVAQGENSGAAVHRELPNYRPLDDYVNNLQAQVFQVQAQNAKDKQQQAKDDRDFFNQKIEGWDRDRKAELSNYYNAIRQDWINLKSKGVNPNDYTNPEAIKFQEKLSGFKNAQAASVQHMEANQADMAKLLADNLTDNPTYDYAKSRERVLKEYESLPIAERIGKKPSDYFVQRERPFDMYAPIKDLKIEPFTSKSAYENDEYSSSGNKLNEKELLSDITARAKNPINKEIYEKGLQQGLWKDESQFIKTQFDRAKLLFQPETRYEKKAPKQVSGWNMDFINGGDINDLLKKSGATAIEYNVPNYNAYTGGATASGDPNKPEVFKTSLPQSYQLGNINITIPTAVARDGVTGQPLESNGVISMTSGLLANALTDKRNGNLIPINKKGNTTVNINGQKFTGTEAELTKKLINAGLAEYKPLLLGTVKIKDDLGTETIKSVIVDANSVVNRMTNKGGKDPLDDATAKLEVLNRKASQENGSSGNSQSGSAKAIPINTIRGYLKQEDYSGYTEKELIKFYEDQGFKVEY